MADTSNLSNFLEDVADAIRIKKETTEKIPAANFDTEILGITTGMDTSDATATADDIINPKTAYVRGEKITGTIIADYVSEGISSELSLVSNKSFQRIIGFAKNNLFSIELDYTNNQFIIRNENFEELKTVPIIDVISDFDNNIAYSGRLYISISNNNVYNNPNCYYVYITLDNYRDYVSVFNFETLTFNYKVEDFPSIYNVLTDKDHYIGAIISQAYFCELDNNVIYGYSHDDNNHKRIYQITLNSDGTVTKTLLRNNTDGNNNYMFGITSSADGSVIQLLFANGNDYDNTNTTMKRRLMYISSTFVTTYKDDVIDYIFSPSGKIAVDSTGVYHNTFDISSKTFTIGDKILDFSSTINALYFINENTFVCFGDNNKQIKVIMLNIDKKSYFMNTYNLDYPITHRSILTSNRLNVINQQYNKLAVTSNDMLWKITKDNTSLYNPYDTTASVNDIIQGKTAYTKDGKVTGAMPNNGELNYEVSASEQTIPEGYTSGGTIAASPLTDSEYNECLTLTKKILNGPTVMTNEVFKTLNSSMIDNIELLLPTDEQVQSMINYYNSLSPTGIKQKRIKFSDGSNRGIIIEYMHSDYNEYAEMILRMVNDEGSHRLTYCNIDMNNTGINTRYDDIPTSDVVIETGWYYTSPNKDSRLATNDDIKLFVDYIKTTDMSSGTRINTYDNQDRDMTDEELNDALTVFNALFEIYLK